MHAQSKSYSVTSGEFIFGWNQIKFNQEPLNGDTHFTGFFHLTESRHFDFNNNFGFYTGLALRNIGYTTTDTTELYDKIKRRAYTIGVPLAIKLGDFRNNKFVYAGIECEMAFHYKEKLWLNDEKSKSSEWFSSKTNRFLPSVFAGIQFNSSLNLQMKYYLNDFLNTHYTKGTYSLSPYNESKLFYLSVSWQLKPKAIINKMERETFPVMAKL